MDAIAQLRRRTMRVERNLTATRRQLKECEVATNTLIESKQKQTMLLCMCLLLQTYQIANNESVTTFVADAQSTWCAMSVEYFSYFFVYVQAVYGVVIDFVSNLQAAA